MTPAWADVALQVAPLLPVVGVCVWVVLSGLFKTDHGDDWGA